MSKRRAFGSIARDARLVDVAQVFSFVADVPLLFEDAKRGANRRVARRVRERLVNSGCGCLASAVQDVHDLALASAQFRDRSGWRHKQLQGSEEHANKTA